MNISTLEQQKEICDSIIEGFKTITATDSAAFETLESIKNGSLTNCILNNVLDVEKSQRLQNEIKIYYLSREYALFLESVKKNLHSRKIIHKVKMEIMSNRKYRYFEDLGLDVGADFEDDLKAFFANYKIAARKVKELESLIEFLDKNRGIHL